MTTFLSDRSGQSAIRVRPSGHDLRPDDEIVRSLIMAMPQRLPAHEGHVSSEGAAERAVRIAAMAASLIESFGSSALAVTLGQPGGNDVCGDSGICWSDLTAALRTHRTAEASGL